MTNMDLGLCCKVKSDQSESSVLENLVDEDALKSIQAVPTIPSYNSLNDVL